MSDGRPPGMYPIATECPSCKRPGDTVWTAGDDGGPQGEPPTPGSASMCWGCGVVAIFELNPLGVLALRKATQLENMEIRDDPNIQQMRAQWRRLHDPYTSITLAERRGRRD